MLPAVERFDHAIYSIRDRGLEPFASIAERGVQRIQALEAFTTLNYAPPRIRSATAFGLQEIPKSGQLHLVTIVSELSDLMNMDSTTFQGDLMRTLAVFDQFPFNGYEGRVRGVYERALDTQQDWLIQTSTPEIPNDPRTTERKRLMRQLMGPAKYNLDIGFEDWLVGIETLVGSDNTPDEDKEILQKYRETKMHFIVQRHWQQALVYKKLVSLGVFDSHSEEDLRKYFAIGLLGTIVEAEKASKKQKGEEVV